MARRSSSVTTNPLPPATDCWHHATSQRIRNNGSENNANHSTHFFFKASSMKKSKPSSAYALFVPNFRFSNHPTASVLYEVVDPTTKGSIAACTAPGKDISNPYTGLTWQGKTIPIHKGKNSGKHPNYLLSSPPPLRLPFIMRQHVPNLFRQLPACLPTSSAASAIP